jgi:hypothetical protein
MSGQTVTFRPEDVQQPAPTTVFVKWGDPPASASSPDYDALARRFGGTVTSSPTPDGAQPLRREE